MSVLLDSCSLMLSVAFLSYDLTPVLTLVDSGTSDHFINSTYICTYVNEHVLLSYPVAPSNFDSLMEL